tara:strand:+ start:154 stop:393 length:240 start_codon:yes stop_codon:yes gene_type:complete
MANKTEIGRGTSRSRFGRVRGNRTLGSLRTNSQNSRVRYKTTAAGGFTPFDDVNNSVMRRRRQLRGKRQKRSSGIRRGY